MLPVYDPKSFADIDLRKYHVRTIKDVIKFQEFVIARMEECAYVLKKFNTQYSTFQTVAQQLQKKLQEQQNSYGAPEATPTEVKVQKVVEVNSDAKEREALLDEMRQAVANENHTEKDSTNMAEAKFSPDRKILETDKYKIVHGKVRDMYYRTMENGKRQLVSEKDVPEDIKELARAHFAKEG